MNARAGISVIWFCSRRLKHKKLSLKKPSYILTLTFLSYQPAGYREWLKDLYFYNPQSLPYTCKESGKKTRIRNLLCKNLLGGELLHIVVASFSTRQSFCLPVNKERDTEQGARVFHGLKSMIYGSHKAVCCVQDEDFAVWEGQKWHLLKGLSSCLCEGLRRQAAACQRTPPYRCTGFCYCPVVISVGKED